MIPKVFKEIIDLGDGRTISIETGKLAKQAHGSVVVQSGKCMMLCTVVSNYEQKDLDFLPLTVDSVKNLLQPEDILAVSSKEKQDQVMVKF